MSRPLTVQNMLSVFPEAMAVDERLMALATVTATELMEMYKANDFLAIYARIDELDEPLLDILAYDFKIDWWDENYSVEEKRQTLKDSWNVHRKLGTPSAVDLAISAIFENVIIKEWWEYGGQPYHFKVQLDVDVAALNSDKFWRVIEKARYYKNKRSVMESMNVNVEPQTTESRIYTGGKVTGVQYVLPPISAAKYNTFADIRDKYTYDDLQEKTYAELLYKEE